MARWWWGVEKEGKTREEKPGRWQRRKGEHQGFAGGDLRWGSEDKEEKEHASCVGAGGQHELSAHALLVRRKTTRE
jgi:hypothetical protein